MHSDASQPLPFYPIGTILALTKSRHSQLQENVFFLAGRSECNLTGVKLKLTIKTPIRWLSMGKQRKLALAPATSPFPPISFPMIFVYYKDSITQISRALVRWVTCCDFDVENRVHAAGN